MDLIYHRGLNCRLASVINIANSLGVNYLDAFSELWSETDFCDEADYPIYTSKRVLLHLEEVGVLTEALDCEERRIEESLSRIAIGEMLLVGMDTFHIPWHPVFRHFHGPHYFFARKERDDSLLCFDPVYNETDIEIPAKAIGSSTFELCRVHRAAASRQGGGVTREARAVLEGHPEVERRLLAGMGRCEKEGRDKIMPLLKQVNAMIDNRYLFQRFLQGVVPSGPFFQDSFMARWEAVRNGLYKAFIIRENEGVIREVQTLFSGLMREEIAMAEAIITIDATLHPL